MADYQYVAWFRDHTVDPEDQDYEWCVCFFIAAADASAAQAWGDALAAGYCLRQNGREEFLRSYLDQAPWPIGAAPRVVAGNATSDDDIGW